ncbi:hypothetical protein ACU4GD_42755 [Cupriavidus basilensis]
MAAMAAMSMANKDWRRNIMAAGLAGEEKVGKRKHAGELAKHERGAAQQMPRAGDS